MCVVILQARTVIVIAMAARQITCGDQHYRNTVEYGECYVEL